MTIPRRLLLLEDSPDDVVLLKKRLAREWPACELVTTDSEEGLRKALSSGEFDLIISDYVLPAFHGLDALALTRKECPEVPFIFLSGMLGDDVAVECLKAGATDYVLKDRPARLVPAIRRALEEAQLDAARKQIDEQLRVSAEALKSSVLRYENLVNSVDGIVWQADLPSLRFTFVSEQCERLLGYPAERWVTEPDFWQDHIYSGDRKRTISVLTRMTADHRYENLEYRMVAADGRVVWISDEVSVRCERGQSAQVQGVMVDISARKQAEERAAGIQVKLVDANRDLVRKNKEIQNFYHTLSHELKTPLTSAREFISIVLDGLAGPLTKDQTDYLGIAKDSCNQLRVCIDDLLDATRLETGKMTLEIKPCPMAALVHRSVLSVQSSASARDIAIFEDVHPDLSEVRLDESRITQVIINLLNNAIKFTPQGGQILIRASDWPAHPEYIQISITDTGRGIPISEQEHIFDRLYQIKAGDASTEQGVGLGLYLCRELVLLHSGSITVESAPGKGSTFSFVLPKTMDPARARELQHSGDTTIWDAGKFTLPTAPPFPDALTEPVTTNAGTKENR